MSGEQRQQFLVNLRGIVEILSHHLYSSPRVYVRELLQNARDAVVARAAADASAPPGRVEIVIDEDDRSVVVRDNGVGLNATGMRELLATIGATSKQKDFSAARSEFLGQFGIGLLSSFLVADEIEVRSRSAREPTAPTTRWVGYADGTFTISPATEPLDTPGTEVRVRARADDASWTTYQRVQRLASEFARYLDLEITVRSADGRSDRITEHPPPWLADDARAAQFCYDQFGFWPLGAIPLDVEVLGVRGVAFISPSAGRVGDRPGDLVYARGMLLAEHNTQLVPGWAVFARVVLEAGDLGPTASREQLHEGAPLAAARAAIGEQLRAGIESLSVNDPARFAEFSHVHVNSLLAMAVDDPDLRDLATRAVLLQTSTGETPLEPLLRRGWPITYVTSLLTYRALAQFAAHQGIVLINAAFVHVPQFLRAVAASDATSVAIEPFELERLVDRLPTPGPNHGDLAGDVRRRVAPALAAVEVDLDLRVFEPTAVPALFVGEVADRPTSRWDAFFAAEAPRPRLVLNLANPAVRALATDLPPHIAASSARAMFVLGRLQSGDPLQENESTMLSSVLHDLIAATVRDPHEGS